MNKKARARALKLKKKKEKGIRQAAKRRAKAARNNKPMSLEENGAINIETLTLQN